MSSACASCGLLEKATMVVSVNSLSAITQRFVLSTTRNKESEWQYIHHTRTLGYDSEDQAIGMVASRSD